MQFLVLGGGLMGRALVHDLCLNPRIGKVTVVDMDDAKLKALKQRHSKEIETVHLDLNDRKAISKLLDENDVMVNATSYALNVGLTRMAIDNQCHMLDLGGNMTVVTEQMAMGPDAKKAGVTVLPNCGLAPGMANVLGAWLLDKFDRPSSLRIFVGGLPLDPRPPLRYMQLFSVQGLINEYVEPVDAIIDGKLVRVAPLDDIEYVTFPDPFGSLEAFNTSGGISMMVRTYEGKVDTMYYKTLRYQGHCTIFRTLLEMGLMSDGPMDIDDVLVSPRAVLERALQRTLPKEGPDATLMQVRATGTRKGVEEERVIQMVDRADPGSGMSSMMRTTAFPTSIMAQMISSGEIRRRGVFTPEMVVDGERLVKEMRLRAIEIELT